MEGGALRRRRKLHATLNGKNRRIFRRLRPGFRSIIIFLTVCTHRRRPLLANREAARLIVTVWQAANFWRIGRYVIMPDHNSFVLRAEHIPSATA
jgi:REP element-mobilizing transposase RayT